MVGLFGRYPWIRVAYIDEIEECNTKRNSTQKVYYSTLVKASITKPNEPGQSHDQVFRKALILTSLDKHNCSYNPPLLSIASANLFFLL